MSALPSAKSVSASSSGTRGRTLEEAQSFKLFDGQSLQYTDRIPDGFYDIWGGFLGAEDNTPLVDFPSVSELSATDYKGGERREVVLVDRRIDQRLQQLEAQAARLMGHNRPTSALAGVQELAVFVAECMGGPSSHSSLSQAYRSFSQQLKAEKRSVVLLLGELTVGLGRHRALLLKLLADNCELPCRLVRGDFYLGAAGHSGEDSIAMLQFDSQEWMVELVSEPGRLHRVRQDPARQPSALRWDASAMSKEAAEAQTTPLHRQGFPTLPGPESRTREESSTSSGSGEKESGLQWSELDGPTMEDLGNSGSDAQNSYPSASSLWTPSQASTAQEGRQSSARRSGSLERHSEDSIKDFASNLPRARVERQASEPLTAEAATVEEVTIGGDGCLQPLQLQSFDDNALVHTGWYGSAGGSGPARARVRARDARGRLMELELHGLTVTHAHNLSLGNRSLDTVRPAAGRQSTDEGSRSLESLIGRYRYIRSSKQHPGVSWEKDRDGHAGTSLESGRTSGPSTQAAPSSSAKIRQMLQNPVPASGVTHEPAQQNLAVQQPRASAAPTVNPQAAEASIHKLLQNPAIAHEARSASVPGGVLAGPSNPANERKVHSAGEPKPAEKSNPASVSIPAEDEEGDVPYEELELGPRIGVGSFGEVFKARWRHTTVAVKRLYEQSLSETSIKEFKAEVMMNRRMKHPNVIMFMGACTKPPNLSIITQWAPRGSLYSLLHSKKPRPPLTLRQKLRMALDIARGLHYLHTARPPVVHRDLKSMNLLVDNDFSIKVCDFGLARIRSSTWMSGTSQGGTPEWTAPEVLRNAQYNEKSDVYSYGVVLYELATERKPWEDMNSMQVVGAVGWAGKRLEPHAGSPPIFNSLMLQCFKDADDRPSFKDIIQELLEFASETRPPGQDL